MKIRIREDLFDISSRIKEVDKNYYIIYDTKKRRYEVHSAMQKDNSFCFVVGKRLDYYAIVKAQKTSIKWLKNIIKNIDEDNKRVEEKRKNEISYKYKTNIKSVLDYIDRKNKTVDCKNFMGNGWR